MLQQRYPFANQLRGIAILCVLFSHYGFFYWSQPAYILSLVPLPANYLASATTYATHVTSINHYLRIVGLDFGMLGVALFFLLSGFVVALSFEHYRPGPFLIARCLRIYPTYWLSLLVMLVLIAVYSHYYYPWPGIISNAFLIHDWLGDRTLNDVNWTLLIEIKFYLLIALAAALKQIYTRFLMIVLSVLSLLLLLFKFYSAAWLLQHTEQTHIINTLVYSVMFLLYMQIGVRFCAWVRQVITSRVFVLDVCYIMLVFIASCYAQSNLNVRLFIVSYVIALGIFLLSAHKRVNTMAWFNNSVMVFFANISYSLYLFHAVIGYILLTFFLQHGAGPIAAILLTTAIIILFSYFAYRFIEKPSHRLGKQLANLL